MLFIFPQGDIEEAHKEKDTKCVFLTVHDTGCNHNAILVRERTELAHKEADKATQKKEESLVRKGEPLGATFSLHSYQMNFYALTQKLA